MDKKEKKESYETIETLKNFVYLETVQNILLVEMFSNKSFEKILSKYTLDIFKETWKTIIQEVMGVRLRLMDNISVEEYSYILENAKASANETLINIMDLRTVIDMIIESRSKRKTINFEDLPEETQLDKSEERLEIMQDDTNSTLIHTKLEEEEVIKDKIDKLIKNSLKGFD